MVPGSLFLSTHMFPSHDQSRPQGLITDMITKHELGSSFFGSSTILGEAYPEC